MGEFAAPRLGKCRAHPSIALVVDSSAAQRPRAGNALNVALTSRPRPNRSTPYSAKGASPRRPELWAQPGRGLAVPAGRPRDPRASPRRRGLRLWRTAARVLQGDSRARRKRVARPLSRNARESKISVHAEPTHRPTHAGVTPSSRSPPLAAVERRRDLSSPPPARRGERRRWAIETVLDHGGARGARPRAHGERNRLSAPVGAATRYTRGA